MHPLSNRLPPENLDFKEADIFFPEERPYYIPREEYLIRNRDGTISKWKGSAARLLACIDAVMHDRRFIPHAVVFSVVAIRKLSGLTVAMGATLVVAAYIAGYLFKQNLPKIHDNYLVALASQTPCPIRSMDLITHIRLDAVRQKEINQKTSAYHQALMDQFIANKKTGNLDRAAQFAYLIKRETKNQAPLNELENLDSYDTFLSKTVDDFLQLPAQQRPGRNILLSLAKRIQSPTLRDNCLFEIFKEGMKVDRTFTYFEQIAQEKCFHSTIVKDKLLLLFLSSKASEMASQKQQDPLVHFLQHTTDMKGWSKYFFQIESLFVASENSPADKEMQQLISELMENFFILCMVPFSKSQFFNKNMFQNALGAAIKIPDTLKRNDALNTLKRACEQCKPTLTEEANMVQWFQSNWTKELETALIFEKSFALALHKEKQFQSSKNFCFPPAKIAQRLVNIAQNLTLTEFRDLLHKAQSRMNTEHQAIALLAMYCNNHLNMFDRLSTESWSQFREAKGIAHRVYYYCRAREERLLINGHAKTEQAMQWPGLDEQAAQKAQKNLETLANAAFTVVAQHALRSSSTRHIKEGLLAATHLNKTMLEHLQEDKIQFALAFEAIRSMWGSYPKKINVAEVYVGLNQVEPVITKFIDNLKTDEFRAFYAQFGENPIIATPNDETTSYRFQEPILLFFISLIQCNSSEDFMPWFSNYDATIKSHFPKAQISDLGRKIFMQFMATLSIRAHIRIPNPGVLGTFSNLNPGVLGTFNNLMQSADVHGVRVFMENIGIPELSALSDQLDLVDHQAILILLNGIQSNNQEILKLVIEGFKARFSDKPFFKTTLYHAIAFIIAYPSNKKNDPKVAQTRLDMMKELIKIDPSIVDFKPPLTKDVEGTPLIEAVKHRNVKAVELLLAEGADRTCHDHNKWNALRHCNDGQGESEKDSTVAIRKLLQAPPVGSKKSIEPVDQATADAK